MYALIDCNSFYCSCEAIFRPDLQGKPIVVLSNNDGCIIARNAEAKALGLDIGGPAFEVKPLLEANGVHIFSSNYTLYADISRRVMNVLTQFSPRIEVYSIDECFIHLEGVPPNELEAFGQKLKHILAQWVKIPVSVGIAPTKTLAKAANRLAKRSKGVWVIPTEEDRLSTLKALPIKDVWGIGRRYIDGLADQGVKTAYDFTQLKQTWVRRRMTITGERTWLELLGTPCIQMQDQREKNDTICTSRSFGRLLTDYDLITHAVAAHAHRCGEKLRTQKRVAQSIHVFLITNRHRKDLPQYNPSASIVFPVATSNGPELVKQAIGLLKKMYKPNYHYMKAGVIVTGLAAESPLQADLFDTLNRPQLDRACAAMDSVNKRMGQDTIRLAKQGYATAWKLRCELRSMGYTTQWEGIPKVTLETYSQPLSKFRYLSMYSALLFA
jgi:DNA polymerase V